LLAALAALASILAAPDAVERAWTGTPHRELSRLWSALGRENRRASSGPGPNLCRENARQWQTECPNKCQRENSRKIARYMSDRMPERLLDRMSEQISDRMRE